MYFKEIIKLYHKYVEKYYNNINNSTATKNITNVSTSNTTN
jgi:hypothetical protein